MSKTPIRTGLAQRLIPAILEENKEAELETLIGQEFVSEFPPSQDEKEEKER